MLLIYIYIKLPEVYWTLFIKS